MLRNYDYIREFNNNNINIKLSPDYLTDIENGKISDIEAISWTLEEIDCYFVGEEFCLSNYDMGAMIYNCYSDMVYIISFSDIERVLKAGKTLKLYARKPDEDDREIIEKEY